VARIKCGADAVKRDFPTGKARPGLARDIRGGFFLPYSPTSRALVWLGKLEGRPSRPIRIPVKFNASRPPSCRRRYVGWCGPLT